MIFEANVMSLDALQCHCLKHSFSQQSAGGESQSLTVGSRCNLDTIPKDEGGCSVAQCLPDLTFSATHGMGNCGLGWLG